MQVRPILPILLLGLMLSACSSAYYATMERFGIEKREILADRVEDARDSQEEAKEQFNSALEQFSALIDFNGGDLEQIYGRLSREFERSEERAEEVRDQIRGVERVSEDLFDEWEDELELYTSESLRASSARTLRNTRDRYEQLIAVMRDAESTMGPVLDAFRDQVLFLRHNLNSQAIASLRTEAVTIEDNVSALIRDMEASIEEANRFLRELELI